MIEFFLITLSIGVLLLLSNKINLSIITRKMSTKKKYSKSSVRIKLDFIKGKNIVFKIINENSNRNLRLKERLKVIYQCKLSDEIYGLKRLKYKNGKYEVNTEISELKSPLDLLESFYIKRTIILVVTVTLAVFMRVYFNKILEVEALSPATIYENLNYKISLSEITSITNYIDDSYIDYLKGKNYNEFYTYLNNFIVDAQLHLEKEDINMILNIYRQAYMNSKFDLFDLLITLCIGGLSIIIFNQYINLKYRLNNIKLLSEFQRIELLALFHMNRKGMTVYEILRKISLHSIYLRPYLDRCLNRYTNDPISALDLLIKEVDNKNMESFITILKSCLSVSKDVNIEILQNQRELRISSDRIDSDKAYEFKLLCLDIASLPVYTLVIFNLIIPFMMKLDFNSIMAF